MTKLGRVLAARPRLRPAPGDDDIGGARRRCPERSGLHAEYALSRAELGTVQAEIRRALPVASAVGDPVRLDTPASLETALGELIAERGGNGRAVVRRQPATLLSPEYWHVRLVSVDGDTLEPLDQLLRSPRAR